MVIPEGPLHPGDAAVALVVGLALGAAAGRGSRPWWATVGVPVAVAAMVWWRLGGDPIVGALEAVTVPGAVVAVLVVAATAAVTARGTVAVTRAWPVAAGGAVGVWAVAPDTEASLMVAAALTASAVVVGARAAGDRTDPPRLGWVAASGVAAVVVAAAVVGTRGRPDRLVPALGAGVAVAVVVAAVGDLSGRVVRRRGRGAVFRRVGPRALVSPEDGRERPRP
ncbi:MAG: hypothetical protein D6683_14980 [Actinomyces sp.]|nr:MAG: hypothetical protein D6683_14980 [Actinomyces sp.]